MKVDLERYFYWAVWQHTEDSAGRDPYQDVPVIDEVVHRDDLHSSILDEAESTHGRRAEQLEAQLLAQGFDHVRTVPNPEGPARVVRLIRSYPGVRTPA